MQSVYCVNKTPAQAFTPPAKKKHGTAKGARTSRGTGTMPSGKF